MAMISEEHDPSCSADLSAAGALFRSLGDVTRLVIVHELARGDRRIVDLTRAVGLAQSTVSAHVACLRDCGLVEGRPQGREMLYPAYPPGAGGCPGRGGAAAGGDRERGGVVPGLWPPRSAGGGRVSGGHAHGVPPAGQRRALTVVLGISSAILAAEVAGAFLAGSLALLADAGHMLSDVAELGLALTAAVLAARPASDERTCGGSARGGPGRRRAGRGAAGRGRFRGRRGDTPAGPAAGGGTGGDGGVRRHRPGR